MGFAIIVWLGSFVVKTIPFMQVHHVKLQHDETAVVLPEYTGHANNNHHLINQCRSLGVSDSIDAFR